MVGIPTGPMGPVGILWEWELLGKIDGNRHGNGDQVIRNWREREIYFFEKFPNHLICIGFAVCNLLIEFTVITVTQAGCYFISFWYRLYTYSVRPNLTYL